MSVQLTLEERVARIEAVLGFDAPATPMPWPLRRAAVLREAARLWGIEVEVLTGLSKTRVDVLARAAVVMVLRTDPPMSYAQIGRLIHRDHSSAVNLHRIARDAFDVDIVFAGRIAYLRRLVTFKPGCAS